MDQAVVTLRLARIECLFQRGTQPIFEAIDSTAAHSEGYSP